MIARSICAFLAVTASMASLAAAQLAPGRYAYRSRPVSYGPRTYKQRSYVSHPQPPQDVILEEYEPVVFHSSTPKMTGPSMPNTSMTALRDMASKDSPNPWPTGPTKAQKRSKRVAIGLGIFSGMLATALAVGGFSCFTKAKYDTWKFWNTIKVSLENPEQECGGCTHESTPVAPAAEVVAKPSS
eukprot:GHVT01018543.1.p2 GENE.GHVT01018543.1~~GHVT01018543.1.p2  ORF type:complete len:185 (-),score=24.31 GHVT01018543.1:596-1150(-)